MTQMKQIDIATLEAARLGSARLTPMATDPSRSP